MLLTSNSDAIVECFNVNDVDDAHHMRGLCLIMELGRGRDGQHGRRPTVVASTLAHCTKSISNYITKGCSRFQ